MPPRPPSRVDLAALQGETLRDVLAVIAELVGSTPERVARRVPAAAALLEMLQAARAVADYRRLGHSGELAVSMAAAELSISPDTLRTRIRDWRRHATGNAPERVKSNPDTLPRAA